MMRTPSLFRLLFFSFPELPCVFAASLHGVVLDSAGEADSRVPCHRIRPRRAATHHCGRGQRREVRDRPAAGRPISGAGRGARDGAPALPARSPSASADAATLDLKLDVAEVRTEVRGDCHGAGAIDG